MITICGKELSFVHMGLFDSPGEWIHPTVTIETYELILVLDGVVNIREGDKFYSVNKGEMLILDPYIEHGGTKISREHTSFYWLHFKTDNIGFFDPDKISRPDEIKAERKFREIMQYEQKGDIAIAELILARFLLELNKAPERRNKTAHNISEYVRIHADRALSVGELSKHFGYAPDHISRIVRNEFGVSAKVLINENRLAYIESLLINTNDTVGDIARKCGFEDENLFLKFFKYHEGKTPTQFRDEFFRVHMNKK